MVFTATVAALASAPAVATSGDPLTCNPAGQQAPTSSARQEAVGAPETIDSAFARLGTNQQIAYDQRTRTTYIGYFDQSGTFTVAARAESGELSFIQPKDADGPVVLMEGRADTHDEIAFGFDEAGGLHVAAGMHNSPMRYWRTTRAGDISTLTWRDALPGAPKWEMTYLVDYYNETTVTYPKFLNTPDGHLYFTFRNGQSGAANNYLYAFSSQSGRWANWATPLFFNGGASFTDTPDNYSAYHEIEFRDGVFHLVWVWRQHPDPNTNSRVSYAWSPDLKNWFAMDRTPLTLPLRPDTTHVLVDAVEHGGLLNGNVKIGFDAAGRVALSYFRNNSQGATKMYVARPNAAQKEWRVSDVTAVPNHQDNVLGEPISAGPDVPAGWVYQSSWSGTVDLIGPQQIFPGALRPEDNSADPRMVVPYACQNGGVLESRQLVVSNTGLSGVTHRVRDEFATAPPLPTSISERDPQFRTYSLATRTVASEAFEVPSSTHWPAAAQGRKAHWVLRWESGPYVANNTWPAAEASPAGGTPLTIHLVLG